MFRRIISLVILGLVSTLSLDLQASRDERYERYVERRKARFEAAAPEVAAWRVRLAHPFTGISGYADLPGPTKALFTKAGIRSEAQRTCLGQLIVLMNSNVDTALDHAGWIAFFSQATTVGALRDYIVTTIQVANAVIERNFPKFAPLIPFFELVVPQLRELFASLEGFAPDAPVEVIQQQDGDFGGDDWGYDDAPVEPKETIFQYALRVAKTHKSTVTAAGATALGFCIAGTCFPILLPAMVVSAGVGAVFGGSVAFGKDVYQGKRGHEMAKDVVHGVAMGGFGGMLAPVVSTVVPAPMFASTFAPLALETAVEGALIGLMTGSVSGLDQGTVLRSAGVGAGLGFVLGGLFGQMREWYANYAAASKAAVDLRPRIAELQGNVTALETCQATDWQVAAVNDQYAGILRDNENLKTIFNAGNDQVKQFANNSRVLVVYRPVDRLVIDVVKKQVASQPAAMTDLYTLINDNDTVLSGLADRMAAAQQARAQAAARALMVVQQPAQPMVQRSALDGVLHYSGSSAMGERLGFEVPQYPTMPQQAPRSVLDSLFHYIGIDALAAKFGFQAPQYPRY